MDLESLRLSCTLKAIPLTALNFCLSACFFEIDVAWADLPNNSLNVTNTSVLKSWHMRVWLGDVQETSRQKRTWFHDYLYASNPWFVSTLSLRGNQHTWEDDWMVDEDGCENLWHIWHSCALDHLSDEIYDSSWFDWLPQQHQITGMCVLNCLLPTN